jgi:hypothetical protein
MAVTRQPVSDVDLRWLAATTAGAGRLHAEDQGRSQVRRWRLIATPTVFGGVMSGMTLACLLTCDIIFI